MTKKELLVIRSTIIAACDTVKYLSADENNPYRILDDDMREMRDTLVSMWLKLNHRILDMED